MRLQRWFERQSRDPLRSSVEDALVTGRARAYVSYRLRFFALTQVLAIVIHVVELLFLRRFVALPSLVRLFVIQSAAQIAGAAWWGLLEGMRAQVRLAMRKGDRAAAARYAGRYVSTGILVAGVVIVAACLTVEPARLLQGGGEGAVEVYKMLTGLRLAASIVARAYHSAALSVRRVYRPVWTTLLADLVGLAFLPLFYRALGPWALPSRMALLAAVSVSVSVFFVRRTLHTLRFYDVRVSLRDALNDPLAGVPARIALSAALAWGVTQAGSALALVAARSPAGGDSSHATFFYVLAPVLTASSTWGNLFYFDLTRYSARAHDILRERLIHRLRMAALGWGVAMGLVGILATYVALRHENGVPWFLPVFAALLGVLSVEQVRLFVARDYKSLLIGIGFLFAAALLKIPVQAYASRFGPVASLIGEMVVLSLGVIAASEFLRSRIVAGDALTVLPRSAWLKALGGAKDSVDVGFVRFAGASRSPTAAFAYDLSDAFPESVWSFADRRTIVWFSPKRERPSDLERDIVLRGAGLVHRVGHLVRAASPSQALTRAHALFLPEARSLDRTARDALVRAFEESVPGGIYARFDIARTDALRGIPALGRVLLLRGALGSVNARPTPHRAARHVVPYAPAGVLTAIFVFPPEFSGEARATWRARIVAAAATGDAST